MKKTLVLWLGIVPLVLLASLLVIPSTRYYLLGLVRNEGFEDNRPTSFWIASLKDADFKKRMQAAAALGSIGPGATEAVPGLVQALKDDDKFVRANAALALFKIGADSPEAVLALGEALEDNTPTVRVDAALALRRIGPKSALAIPALIKALRDPTNQNAVPPFTTTVTQLAVAALGRIGPQARDAIPVLTAILDDKDSSDFLLQEAAQALDAIHPRAAGD
jgi:HEAT repeat protein